ncbi:MAG: pirin family protein [Campylobacteraceae bacterium]|jgi:redox-sensitive bicupin YhaK (pirin superfamily)|nr:pirin family protein [Campylobacteraceae bacterium]
MIKKIEFNKLFESNLGWLQSRFHFSFAEYFNPQNINFGALRVMNDDIVQPKTGFTTHPHKDMEIFSYLLDGELTHGDSMGNKETLQRGDMQYMSAGTGVLHSEMNNHPQKPTRFIQTWIVPNSKNLQPNYGSKRFTKEDRLNKWLHLLGGENSDAYVNIHQDANAYVSEIESGRALKMPLLDGRQAYLKVMEGSIKINDTELNHGDAAEITDEDINIFAQTNAHIMLIELAKV